MNDYIRRMSATKHDPVLKFIAAVQSAFNDNIKLYTSGHCYEFYLILRSVWPHAELWYDEVSCHVLTRIGGYWYDITGRFKSVPQSCIKVTSKNRRFFKACHKWSKRSGFYLGRKPKL